MNLKRTSHAWLYTNAVISFAVIRAKMRLIRSICQMRGGERRSKNAGKEMGAGKGTHESNEGRCVQHVDAGRFSLNQDTSLDFLSNRRDEDQVNQLPRRLELGSHICV